MPHDSSNFLLGPQSLGWQIMRERVLALGAGRTILLQLGHPLVGAGVEQHSHYQSDPWRRIRHTVDFYLRLVHARKSEAAQLRAWLAAAHHGVEGQTAGRTYSADDDQLRLWVHATVADSALWLWQQLHGPLSLPEQERWWAEQRLLAQAIGIDDRVLPQGAAAWRLYMHDSFAQLEAGPAAHQVWQMLGQLPGGPRRVPKALWQAARPPAARVLVLATSAGTPHELRQALGIAWTPDHERRWRRSCRVLALGQRLSPASLRYSQRALRAQRPLEGA